MNQLNYCVCKEQDQCLNAHGQSKIKRMTLLRKRKQRKANCHQKPDTYNIVQKTQLFSDLRHDFSTWHRVPRAFNILPTGTQKSVKESALRLSGMCPKHYFFLPLSAVTSFILSFKCLTSTCLPSSCLCGCTQSSFIPMKCAVTGSVMTDSVRGTLRGAAYYCCMFKALPKA